MGGLSLYMVLWKSKAFDSTWPSKMDDGLSQVLSKV